MATRSSARRLQPRPLRIPLDENEWLEIEGLSNDARWEWLMARVSRDEALARAFELEGLPEKLVQGARRGLYARLPARMERDLRMAGRADLARTVALDPVPVEFVA